MCSAEYPLNVARPEDLGKRLRRGLKGLQSIFPSVCFISRRTFSSPPNSHERKMEEEENAQVTPRAVVGLLCWDGACSDSALFGGSVYKPSEHAITLGKSMSSVALTSGTDATVVCRSCYCLSSLSLHRLKRKRRKMRARSK